jgi:hypothetical protein
VSGALLFWLRVDALLSYDWMKIRFAGVLLVPGHLARLCEKVAQVSWKQLSVKDYGKVQKPCLLD